VLLHDESTGRLDAGITGGANLTGPAGLPLFDTVELSVTVDAAEVTVLQMLAFQD
jgi:hypothetical protein